MQNEKAHEFCKEPKGITVFDSELPEFTLLAEEYLKILFRL